MKHLLTLLLALPLLMLSCKKKDDPNLQQRLQAHEWRLAGIKQSGVMMNLNACALDNLEIFKEKTGYEDYGAQQCDPQEPRTVPFDYTVSADQKTIYQIYPALSATLTNITCDDANLIYDQVNPSDGLTYTWTYVAK